MSNEQEKQLQGCIGGSIVGFLLGAAICVAYALILYQSVGFVSRIVFWSTPFFMAWVLGILGAKFPKMGKFLLDSVRFFL